MIKSVILTSFLGLTSSALIGGSIYREKEGYLIISNEVTENKADSLINKLTQHEKNLNEVQSKIINQNLDILSNKLYQKFYKEKKAGNKGKKHNTRKQRWQKLIKKFQSKISKGTKISKALNQKQQNLKEEQIKVLGEISSINASK